MDTTTVTTTETTTVTTTAAPETTATVAVDSRSFMQTPINNYTVSEGLLLCIALLLLLCAVTKLLRGIL